MNVILRLAWRDTRASRRRLLLYSGTIVLGIAALVAVGSFGANLRKTMGDQPKRLLGGDLRVGLSSWPNPAFQAYMDSIGAVEAREKIFNSPLSAPGRDTPRQSVLVLAIGGPFPLYGELTAAPAGAVDRFRRGERVALIDSQVAERYRLKPGDPITLAGAGYTVAGVIGDMPGAAAQMFVLTGQVVVPWSAAVPDVAAGKPPKRGSYRLFFRLPAGADEAAVATEVKNRFPDAFPVIMTSAELGKNIDTALLQTSRFFSLVLFISLFLGAIGVASAFHVYVQERLPTVAILRCLGASVAESIGVYLCQALALGCVGAVGGALVGLAAQRAIPRLVQSFLPVHLEVFLAWKPVLAGMAAGLCISFVFTLLPLLPIRRVSPLSALRSDFSPGPGADPARAVVWGLIAAAVAGFAYWQTRSLPVMLAYTVALAFAFGVFAGAAALLTFAIRRFFPSGAPYVLRQGVANLHRPRNRTLLLLLSLGLGIFLVLTIYLVRSTLLSDFGGEASANVVVSNVPDEDAATVLGLAGSEKMRVLRQIPSLRVSVESVDGKPPVPRRGSRMPEGNLFAATYRDRLLPYEHLVEGSFTGRVQPGSPVVPVTVAMWTTGRGGLFRLGDEVVWNVAGVPVEDEDRRSPQDRGTPPRAELRGPVPRGRPRRGAEGDDLAPSLAELRRNRQARAFGRGRLAEGPGPGPGRPPRGDRPDLLTGRPGRRLHRLLHGRHRARHPGGGRRRRPAPEGEGIGPAPVARSDPGPAPLDPADRILRPRDPLRRRRLRACGRRQRAPGALSPQSAALGGRPRHRGGDDRHRGRHGGDGGLRRPRALEAVAA